MLSTSLAVFLTSALLAHAVVTPDEPSPGRVYNEGSDCHITWRGDTASPDAWKDMTIKLRTGSNLAMTDITVIATGLDGTVDGVHDYPCPDVTPQAAVYFYEFTAPGAAADGATWTTRFTIADSTGATVPPENANQPNGDPIPWGVGRLESGTPSGAVLSGSAAPTGAGPSSAVASSSAALPSASGFSASRAEPSASAGASASHTSASRGVNAAAATQSGEPNGAVAMVSGDVRLVSVAAFLGTAAMAFSLL